MRSRKTNTGTTTTNSTTLRPERPTLRLGVLVRGRLGECARRRTRLTLAGRGDDIDVPPAMAYVAVGEPSPQNLARFLAATLLVVRADNLRSETGSRPMVPAVPGRNTRVRRQLSSGASAGSRIVNAAPRSGAAGSRTRSPPIARQSSRET